MADCQQQLCFSCEENVRLDGDFLCRSCKEEYRKCYECGERERNHPFKLCTACYQELRSGVATVSVSKSPRPTPAPRRLTPSGRSATQQSRKMVNLLKIDSRQQTFKDITAHFLKEWVKLTEKCPKPPIPTAVFAVQNSFLTEKFHSYGDQIRKGRKSSSANADLFFHGTKLNCDILASSNFCDDLDCGVCGISKKGFDPALIGKNIPRFQRFGRGIYLAPNSSKCHDYTQGNPDYGFRAQLLCLVACGAKYELLNDSTKLVAPPSSFHSVHGKAGGSLNYDEIVVYQAEAVLPQYVVVYELDGVEKIAK